MNASLPPSASRRAIRTSALRGLTGVWRRATATPGPAGVAPWVGWLGLGLWLAVAGNTVLWSALWALPEVSGARGLVFMAAFALALGGVLLALLAVLAVLGGHWGWRVGGTVLLACAAAATPFMSRYGVVVDASMLTNVLKTDVREAADLMSPSLLLHLLVLGVAPAVVLWRVRWRPLVGASRWVRAPLLAVGGLAVALLLMAGFYADLASVMRNHKSVRYQINPLNTVYAAARLAVHHTPRAQRPLQAVGTDARLGPTHAASPQAPLLVLVVGETARAANFSLGGYARDTNPELSAIAHQGHLLWMGNAQSCGTNTEASVPCMFSALGKAGHEAADAPHENLLDVLQRAGLGVVWLDNQSGCKGVCDRVPNINTREGDDPVLCPGGECLDARLLQALPEQIAALPPERRARGVVAVLHQMGNHGPAYHKRSPADRKPFQPECTSNALQDCPREHLVNAYDNAIRYTDHVLASTIRWLQTQSADTALLYVSDHGESLGEGGFYLHGLPYAIAPQEQTHVPWVTWVSPALQARLSLDMGCLKGRSAQRISHDHLFHTVLGLVDVQTEVHRSALDLIAPCLKNK